MSLIYKCDRCKSTNSDEYSMYTVAIQDMRRNLDSKHQDLCSSCWRDLYKWLKGI